jgi:hypothetical protein
MGQLGEREPYPLAFPAKKGCNGHPTGYPLHRKIYCKNDDLKSELLALQQHLRTQNYHIHPASQGLVDEGRVLGFGLHKLPREGRFGLSIK